MRKKLSQYFMLGSALIIAITAIAALFIFNQIFKTQIYDDLHGYTLLLYHMSEQNIKSISEQVEHFSDKPWDKELRLTLVDSDGTVLYDSLENEKTMENHRNRPEIEDALKKGQGEALRKSATNNMHTFYYAIRLKDGKVLRVGKDSDCLYRAMEFTAGLMLIIALLLVGLSQILAHYLTGKLINPIERISKNLDAAPMEDVYEEIRPFLNTIREQHVNILQASKIRQEFTANVSHELKTPLTSISGYAELIANGMTDENDTQHFAKEIHHNANRLLNLINDILQLSKLDDSDCKVEMENVDLYAVAQTCVDMMDVQANKQGIDLRLKGKHCMIRANKAMMEEVIYNLCSNAIRYNNPGGSVQILVEEIESKVMLLVKDTGIGISPENQERIFERFYRVDMSRSRSSGGTGLGLAIVKHIVERHGAQMELHSEVGKGTEVQILFSE